MRRFDESREDDFERSVELGERNLECLRGMSGWCSHVEIESQASGLYAQLTGLPIGSYSISCPYVDGQSTSMNLKWIFGDFLVNHCSECPHHVAGEDPSWGKGIIAQDAVDKKRHAQESKESHQRIAHFRANLRERASAMKDAMQPQARTIVEILENLFSDNIKTQSEAAEQLTQSLELAPELFPDAAINLIIELAETSEYSTLLLPVCKQIALHVPSVADRLQQLVSARLKVGVQTELCAEILRAMGNSTSFPLSKECVRGLICGQCHSLPFGGWGGAPPSYPHTVSILLRNYDLDENLVLDVIREGLRSKDDATRVTVCGAIQLLEIEHAGIATRILRDLFDSLNQQEAGRTNDYSPSTKIIEILSQCYSSFPKDVEWEIDRIFSTARPAVQEDIVKILHRQFRGFSDDWDTTKQRRTRTSVSIAEELSARRLIDIAKDDNVEIDIRVEAARSLKSACDYAASAMISHFDSILGYYALMSECTVAPERPKRIILPNEKPIDSNLVGLEQANRNQHWGSFKNSLEGCLEELCEKCPTQTLSIISDTLNTAGSQIGEQFQGCCIALLAQIGKSYELRTMVMPFIMKGLMNYDSVWVRMCALQATNEMFHYSKGTPPTDVIDVVVLHLRDQYVAVHQAATSVLERNANWCSDSQAIEAIQILSTHLNAYKKDPSQIAKVCDAILSLGTGRDQRFLIAAVRLVGRSFPTGEEYPDSEVAQKLTWSCDPEGNCAVEAAKCILEYLARYERDHWNSYSHSERLRMFEWLHRIPRAELISLRAPIRTAALKLAMRDQWEACHFSSLAVMIRDYTLEKEILATAVDSLPKEPRHQEFMGVLNELRLAAEGNSQLLAENFSEANNCFHRISES